MSINLSRLKAYRALHRENQKDIAEVLGICLTSYCHKEQGYKEFSGTEIGKMAEHWNIPPGDLFSKNPLLR